MAFAIVLITRLTLFPLRSNLSVLQVSLYATAAAPFLTWFTTLWLTRSPRCTGCLLPGGLNVTRTGLPPASRRWLYRTHEPVIGGIYNPYFSARFSVSQDKISFSLICWTIRCQLHFLNIVGFCKAFCTSV
jgi:hypothetical protein